MSTTCSKSYTIKINPQAAGPNAWWKMDELAGDRIDSIAGIHLVPTGTVNNVPGRINLGVQLTANYNSGPPFFLTLPSLIDSGVINTITYAQGNDISFACWIEYNTLTNSNVNPNFYYLGFEVDGVTQAFSISISAVDNVLPGPTQNYSISLIDSNTTLNYQFDAKIPRTTGVWHLIVGVYRSATGELSASFDGSPLAVATGTPDVLSGAAKLQIGLTNSIIANPLRLISWDECGIWTSYALTNTDVASLWNGGLGKTFP